MGVIGRTGRTLGTSHDGSPAGGDQVAEGEAQGRGLTPADVAAVLRRASELDAASELPRSLPEVVPAAVVEEAGVEAGISREAIQRALAELVVAPLPGAVEVIRPGLPERLEVLRDVAGPARDVNGRIDRYLRRQLFVRQRIYGNGSRWAPRRGLFATMRRWIGTRSRHELRPVGAVDVRVADDPSGDGGRVLVRIDADLGLLRRRQVGAAAVGTTLVAAGSGWLVALNGPELLLVVVPLGGGAIAGSIMGARMLARRAVTRIETALHGLVDRIEHGPRDSRAAFKAAVRDQRDAALMHAADQMLRPRRPSRSSRSRPGGGSPDAADVPDAAADG
jgi:hypothetical protein